ncbi:MAG TPA: hypothetical protein VGG84_08270 [Gemmatimonadaceae bacterium]|jgi:hypothetical protein
MTSSTFGRRATATTLFMIGALATVLACRGNETTTAPLASTALAANSRRADVGGSGEQSPPGNAYGRPAQPVVCADRKAVVESGVFGPSGGTLIFGDSRLIIPGGALRGEVTITATAIGGSSSEVDFQPHGLHFEKPVGLALGSAGCAVPEEGMPNIVYLSDDGTVLETISAQYYPQWKVVAAPIEHFSGYAIAFSR